MREVHLAALRCPQCGKKLQFGQSVPLDDDIQGGQIVCEKGHAWEINNGIPSLVYPPVNQDSAKWITQHDEMAESHDELFKQYYDRLGIDIVKEQESLAIFIPIKGPVRIIDANICTAANFIALHRRFKNQIARFDLYGMDLSTGMLKVAQRKIAENEFNVSLTHGSMFNIPYQSSFFDIVLHSGDINAFSDIHSALDEMLRIVHTSGRVIVVDKGLSPRARSSEKGRDIIKADSLFASRPPLEFLPDKARNVEVSYVMNETFYQMTFTK
jgi:ubiquinone/menaquinone biosynthesis C-methylase UbiE/uncharacterized protein YbaR (Trm112 family)